MFVKLSISKVMMQFVLPHKFIFTFIFVSIYNLVSCQGKPFDANDIILITFNVNGKVEQIIGFVEKVDPVDSKGNNNKLCFFF